MNEKCVNKEKYTENEIDNIIDIFVDLIIDSFIKLREKKHETYDKINMSSNTVEDFNGRIGQPSRVELTSTAI